MELRIVAGRLASVRFFADEESRRWHEHACRGVERLLTDINRMLAGEGELDWNRWAGDLALDRNFRLFDLSIRLPGMRYLNLEDSELVTTPAASGESRNQLEVVCEFAANKSGKELLDALAPFGLFTRHVDAAGPQA